MPFPEKNAHLELIEEAAGGHHFMCVESPDKFSQRARYTPARGVGGGDRDRAALQAKPARHVRNTLRESPSRTSGAFALRLPAA